MNTILDPNAAVAAAIPDLFRRPGDRRANHAIKTAADSGVRNLQKGAILAVSRPLHQDIACLRGSLWITHDGDPKDIILEAGQSYRSDRCARMLIQALDEADIQVAVAGGGLPQG